MQSIPGFWNPAWREDALEQALSASGGLAYVADEGGEVIGFICAHDLGFRAYLNELVVAEPQQGKGIGRRLLERVELELRARGCGIIVSDVWKTATGFYESMGWSAPDVILLRKRF